jgi:ADP-ribosylation factor-binding protein GGA
MNRYEAYKKGDYTTAANPIPKELDPKNDPVSLIDFDDSQSPSTQGASPGANELADLFGSSAQAPAIQGGINMGIMPAMTTTPPIHMSNTGMMGGIMGQPTTAIPTHSPSPMMFNNPNNSLFANRTSSISPPQAAGTPPASIMLPTTPQPNTGSPAPNYYSGQMNNGMGGMGMMGMSNSPMQQPMGMGIGMPTMQTQVPQVMQTQAGQTQPQPARPSQVSGKDPFADLAGLF